MLSPVFKKMNLKSDITEIVILNAPESFETEIALLENVSIVRDTAEVEKIKFGLAFVTTLEGVQEATKQFVTRADGDMLLWLAYPKKSSKKYTCEFNRDTGWSALGDVGFEPVRQVAVDVDWSALRFRHVDFIKTMKRRNSMALSAEGKKRTKKNQ